MLGATPAIGNSDRERIDGAVIVRTQSDYIRFSLPEETTLIDLVGARAVGVDYRTFLISGRGVLFTDATKFTNVVHLSSVTGGFDGLFRCTELTK